MINYKDPQDEHLTEAPPEELFDWQLFGAMVRNMRRKRGWAKAEHFSIAIHNRTRLHISADTLYKIESGRQVPSSMQLFAMMLALGLKAPEVMDVLMRTCSCEEWKELYNGEVPFNWRVANTRNLAFEMFGESGHELDALNVDADMFEVFRDSRDVYVRFSDDPDDLNVLRAMEA